MCVSLQALCAEPAGTFICRFSMSQPGCLVLSCKVALGHPKADDSGVIQAIIKVGGWLLDWIAETDLYFTAPYAWGK